MAMALGSLLPPQNAIFPFVEDEKDETSWAIMKKKD
jgi:hypothetical protein